MEFLSNILHGFWPGKCGVPCSYPTRCTRWGIQWPWIMQMILLSAPNLYIRPHPNSRSPTWATSQSTASLEQCPGCENSCTSKDPIYVWENRAGCRLGIWLTQKTWYASWANCQALLRNGGQSVELEEAMHLQSGCHSLCLLRVAQPYLRLPLWDWTMGKDGCSLRYPWSFISSFRWGCFDTTS